ncbi:conserved hypothetical protein [Ricinus communis]|uniref:Uncharacterized protein n=1 Tax=Ricinus communis TaxID=3988 RepID=B9SJU1_RICCO|nr:conserved hypothetical protein [Ricinus communis]
MLEDFITSAKICPSEFVMFREEIEENPKYENWIVQDEILLGVVVQLNGTKSRCEKQDEIKIAFKLPIKGIKDILYSKIVDLIKQLQEEVLAHIEFEEQEREEGGGGQK